MKRKFNPFISSMAIIAVSTLVFLASAFPVKTMIKNLSERGIENLLETLNLYLSVAVGISLLVYVVYRAVKKDEKSEKD